MCVCGCVCVCRSDVPGIRGNGKSKGGDLLREKMEEEVIQFCEESQEVTVSSS